MPASGGSGVFVSKGSIDGGPSVASTGSKMSDTGMRIKAKMPKTPASDKSQLVSKDPFGHIDSEFEKVFTVLEGLTKNMMVKFIALQKEITTNNKKPVKEAGGGMSEKE